MWNFGSNTSAILSLTDLHINGDYNDFDLTDIPFSTVANVPEPTNWPMMLLGAGGMGVALRSRRKAPFSAL